MQESIDVQARASQQASLVSLDASQLHVDVGFERHAKFKGAYRVTHVEQTASHASPHMHAN